MNSLPLVSVIIANYNKATYICETVTSILNQSYVSLELIIVDDCSTDASLDVLQKSFNDPRIKIIANAKNNGANYCRNIGLKTAYGKYVIFIDSDDLMVTTCIEERMNLALKNPEVDLLVFSMGVFYSKIGDGSFIWKPISTNPLRDILQHKLPWTILQPLWRKDKLIQLGGFDETFQRLQDVELHTRALLDKSLTFKLVAGKPDCYYRIDESRKVFDSFVFLNKWVNSTLQYCGKFQELVPSAYKRFLAGTVFQTFLQVLHKRKVKEISAQEFKSLERSLMDHRHYRFTKVNSLLFRFAKFYNLYFFRIPGVNKLVHLAIIALA